MVLRFERSDALRAVLPGDLASVVEIEVPERWVQLTYNALRIAPAGDTIAMLDAGMDVWELQAPSFLMEQELPQYSGVYHRHKGAPFSDIVIIGMPMDTNYEGGHVEQIPLG